ncbi:hypothetical protein E4U42_002561 [Claviceps africana]|uniref:Uncharacterized protein n=1 Tax=Claviceps africana TaxID=83212 RepID=A0A8K0J7U4_9HYPO|nr:hypothetical protein E4U42_002561 [Claviceps africana]
MSARRITPSTSRDLAATSRDTETLLRAIDKEGDTESVPARVTPGGPLLNDDDEEAELERRLAAAAKALRLARKRNTLKRLKQGLNNPYDHNNDSGELSQINTPVISRTATPTLTLPTQQRHSFVQVQLKAPTYKGGTYESLQIFLFDLDVVFFLDPNTFTSDHIKVAYATGCLAGVVKKQWLRYAAIDYRVDFKRFTWEEFVSWLKKGIIDEDAR